MGSVYSGERSAEGLEIKEEKGVPLLQPVLTQSATTVKAKWGWILETISIRSASSQSTMVE
jgi:hypothetical protein